MSFFGNLYTDPFSDLLDMQRRMDRLMTRFGSTESNLPLLTSGVGEGGGGGGGTSLVGTGAGQIAQWNPRMDVRDTDKGLILHAELPGCSRDDIKLSFDHNTNSLVLQGEKKTKKKDRGENWVRKERFEGTFYRTLPLPPGCDVGNIQANFTNGVLKVTIPKPPETSRRQMIDIKTSEKAGGVGQLDQGLGLQGQQGFGQGLQDQKQDIGFQGQQGIGLQGQQGIGQGLQGQKQDIGLQGQQGSLGEKTVPISSTGTTSGVEEPRPNIQTQSTVF
jgi:HSP20 family protein